MTAHSAQLTDAAQLLYDARSSGTSIQPMTQMYPDLDVAQAYSVQRLNLARHIGQGSALLGHKIGLTSAPIQKLLGVNEPDFGYILDSTMLPNGAEVPVSAFCAPRVEPEVAFLMRVPLRGPGVTVDDVMGATEAVAPALQIVDSRIGRDAQVSRRPSCW